MEKFSGIPLYQPISDNSIDDYFEKINRYDSHQLKRIENIIKRGIDLRKLFDKLNSSYGYSRVKNAFYNYISSNGLEIEDDWYDSAFVFGTLRVYTLSGQGTSYTFDIKFNK